jgi:hypothetical protein
MRSARENAEAGPVDGSAHRLYIAFIHPAYDVAGSVTTQPRPPAFNAELGVFASKPSVADNLGSFRRLTKAEVLIQFASTFPLAWIAVETGTPSR